MEISEMKCKTCGGPIHHCFDVPHVYDWENEYCCDECFHQSEEYKATNSWMIWLGMPGSTIRKFARKHIDTIKYILEDGNPYSED